MSEKIKLENIVDAGFDSENGEAFRCAVEEYVCSACRHLVEKDDTFCTSCGEELVDSGKVEHHYGGKKLSDTEYMEELGH